MMRPFAFLVACVACAGIALPGLAAAPSGPGPAISPLPSARAEAPATGVSRADIRAATAGLAVAGYAPGSVDGDWDAADREALLAWQADWKLPQTGELNPDLVLRLIREHPETAPRWVETETGCRVWNRYPQPRETVTWTGPCLDGMTSGTGRLTWTSVFRGERRLETYDGERREGRENGEGLYVGHDGSRYRGGWRDGLKDGEGIYVSPEGHVYVGEYRDGLRHGRGTYLRTEGARYEGEWRDGVQHGTGVAVWPDGSRYEGRLVDGRPQGEGTLTFADGNVYSGVWRSGCFAEGLRGATAGVTPADCGWK
jgi:hypothetical protein